MINLARNRYRFRPCHEHALVNLYLKRRSMWHLLLRFGRHFCRAWLWIGQPHSLELSITKCQGWMLWAEGARTASDKIALTSSTVTLRPSNFVTLCRFWLSFWKFHDIITLLICEFLANFLCLEKAYFSTEVYDCYQCYLQFYRADKQAPHLRYWWLNHLLQIRD